MQKIDVLIILIHIQIINYHFMGTTNTKPTKFVKTNEIKQIINPDTTQSIKENKKQQILRICTEGNFEEFKQLYLSRFDACVVV